MDTARHDWRLKAVAWVLMLAASLLNLLNFNDYPIARGEVALVFAALAVIAAGITLAERLAPRLAFILTGALVGLGADLNTNVETLPLIIGIVAASIAWFHNQNVVKLATAAFGTVTLFQLAAAATVTSSATFPMHAPTVPGGGDAAKPPIIHLLMDSFLGTEGMAADPAFAQLRDETVDFYTGHGFRLYDGAYSRHANTANSVPYILSFGTAKAATVSQRTERLIPDRLDYFERLAAHGYGVSIMGADFIDLCYGQPVDDCRQFSHSKLSAITSFPMSTGDRAKTIGVTLASMSNLTSQVYDLSAATNARLRGERPMVMRNLKKLAPPKSALALNELRQILHNPQYGRLYFAHLLIPHEPYVFDDSCTLRPRSQWNTEMQSDDRPERDADYRAQMRCTLRLLDEVLTTLGQSEAGRAAIVIIHGDHGSRIVDMRPNTVNAAPSPRDFAMTYSTLFAVRAPGLAPEVVEGRASLDELLRDLAMSDFRKAPETGRSPAQIILATQNWVPKITMDLPEY